MLEIVSAFHYEHFKKGDYVYRKGNISVSFIANIYRR